MAKKTKRQKAATKKAYNEKRRISRLFDVPISNVVPGGAYANADSADKIQKLIDRDKQKRLRYKGRFVSKSAQEQILKFSTVLEQGKQEFNLAELLAVPEIEKKVVISKSKTPKEHFYWNAGNLIHNFKTKNETYGGALIIIKDFDGTILFKGRDKVKAAAAMVKVNRKIDAVSKVINEVEGVDPYFTIPTFDEYLDGKYYKVTIDLPNIQGRMSKELMEKYKTQF